MRSKWVSPWRPQISCYRIAVLSVMSVLILNPASIRAQTSSAQDSLALSLCMENLQSGAFLRVRTDSVYTEGKFCSAQSGNLLLETDDAQRSIRLAQVDELWESRNAARKGARIGGLTLGALGGVSGAFLVAAAAGSSGSENPGGLAYAGGVLVGGFLGFAVGSGGGALAGSFVESWYPLYP